MAPMLLNHTASVGYMPIEGRAGQLEK